MDDELYDDENPMEYHDKMEQLWQETKESLKEKSSSTEEAVTGNSNEVTSDTSSDTTVDTSSEMHSEMDNVVDGVRESSTPITDDVEPIVPTEKLSINERMAELRDNAEGKTGDLFAGLAEAKTTVTKEVGDATTNLMEGAKDVGSNLLDETKEVASNVIDEGSSMVSGTAIAIGAAAGGFLVGAKKMVEKTVDGATELAEGTVDVAKEGVNKSAETLNDAFNSMKEKTSELVQEGAETVNEASSSLVDNDIPSVLRPKDIFKQETSASVEAEKVDERIEPAKEKITGILTELKENNYNKDYGILGYVLSFPIILVAIWQFIQVGFTLRMGVVALLALYFVAYRGAVKGITKKVFDLKAKVQVGQMTPKVELFSKIEYVLSGIELNLKRINYTKWLYLIFTPILFYGLGEIWKGPFDSKTSFYMFVVGFALSFVIWPFVFKADYKKLEELEIELSDIKREFQD